MAYNQKNILVNMTEAIRKGGGGGQIPALQLAVSQLQVSMSDVKASVANVSAEVDRIKAELAAVANLQALPVKCGKWGEDDLYKVRYTATSKSLAASSGTKLYELPTGAAFVKCAGTIQYSANYKADISKYEVYQYSTDGNVYIWNSDNEAITADIDIEIFYTVSATRNTKKGGRK